MTAREVAEMYIARREFGKVARVYRTTGALEPERPRAWAFAKSHLCGAGVAATGRTPQLALMALHSIEDDAATEYAERAFVRYVDRQRIVREVTR